MLLIGIKCSGASAVARVMQATACLCTLDRSSGADAEHRSGILCEPATAGCGIAGPFFLQTRGEGRLLWSRAAAADALRRAVAIERSATVQLGEYNTSTHAHTRTRLSIPTRPSAKSSSDRYCNPSHQPVQGLCWIAWPQTWHLHGRGGASIREKEKSIPPPPPPGSHARVWTLLSSGLHCQRGHSCRAGRHR